MSTAPPPRPEGLPPVRLVDLATAAGARVVPPAAGSDAPGTRPVAEAAVAEVAVTGVTLDSRAVLPGDLYAALPGARTHGARFVADAAAAGAVAVLTDPDGAGPAADAGLPALVVADPRAVLGGVAAQAYGHPSRSLTIIGVTGTSGKTTVSHLVEAGLRAAGRRTGLLGTVENRIGDTRLDAARTTPEAPDLQALLAVMVQRGVDAVAMEVSSHALALGRVDGTAFAVGAFTNLGLDHLDFHADLEDYFAAKARLFDGRCAVEVVDVDDAYGRRLVRPGTVTVSTAGRDATWRAVDVRVERTRQVFTVHGPGGLRLPASVAMPGAFNVANALLAIVCCVSAGVDPAAAVAGVAAAPGVPGRLERVGGAGTVLGIVDYAHKPEAVAAVLTTLREVTTGRLLCVLGCGGDRDAGKRGPMGAAAARGADLLVVTDDNPRSEDPVAIRAAALAGAAGVPAAERAELREIGDRRAAIVAAVDAARPGDTVAVLGKGHESYQEVDGVVHPFDDRQVLAAALAAAPAVAPAVAPATARAVAPAGNAGGVPDDVTGVVAR